MFLQVHQKQAAENPLYPCIKDPYPESSVLVQAFLHGLQCLSVFLENGGPTYIANFHEVRALEPFIAKFVGSNFTLDDLLLPMDLNVPGWMHKVLHSLVAPFKFQAMFGVIRNPPAIPGTVL
jgi:hypothetical protein